MRTRPFFISLCGLGGLSASRFKVSLNRFELSGFVMFESAYAKIAEASERIDGLSEFIRERPPFRYMLETNTNTCERSTFAKQDKAVITAAAVKIGGVMHELRSAIDHGYWEVVSPFATTPREKKAIQFPFSETATRLDEAMANRLAPRVGADFVREIKGLKPYGDAGGNELLYFIHQANGADKHRFLTPVADYKSISSPMIRRQVPDFPPILTNVGFSGGFRDITWSSPPGFISPPTLPGLPAPTKFEQEIDIPIDVVLYVRPPEVLRPAIPMLHALVDVTKGVLKTMEPFAPS